MPFDLSPSTLPRNMKQLKYIFLFIIAPFVIAGCGGKSSQKADDVSQDTIAVVETVPDSTIYGVVGDGTAMHTLQLITDVGDTLSFMLTDADDNSTVVLGGMLAGDRVAVMAYEEDNGQVAKSVINITSLLGKWSSIDKSFEIREGGVVESAIKAETNPWTSWKLCNGRIILNTDTFLICDFSINSHILFKTIHTSFIVHNLTLIYTLNRRSVWVNRHNINLLLVISREYTISCTSFIYTAKSKAVISFPATKNTILMSLILHFVRE